MQIFVVGATGILGRRVVPAFIRDGHRVTGVARSADKASLLERVGATPVYLDVFDAAKVTRAVEGHDAIVNLATAIPPSSRALLPGVWRATNQIRRTVPRILAAAARTAGITRLVQESFAPTYPGLGSEWIDESVPIRPARYNRGVAHAEAAVRAFAEEDGTGVIMRFAFFYSADSDFTRDMLGMVRKGWSPLPGPPQAYISSIHVDDAAAAVLAALGLPSGAYNVCDNEPVTHREFTESLAALLKAPRPRFAPAWMTILLGSLGETLARSQRISNRKLRAASAWTPRYTNIREGWLATVRELSREQPYG
jgi:nucleoside-diphosphate-sugar epimerase